MPKVVAANDHGAVDLMKRIIAHLEERGYEVTYLGTATEDSVDYPDKAREACLEYRKGGYDFGVLCCGTGIGISMAANKIKGIRAALCADCYSARMAKEHNNANVIAFGGRTVGVEHAWEMVCAYMKAEHLGGVLGNPVSHPVLSGKAEGGLGHVHPHNLKILKALQGDGQGTPDQAQAYNDKGLFHFSQLPSHTGGQDAQGVDAHSHLQDMLRDKAGPEKDNGGHDTARHDPEAHGSLEDPVRIFILPCRYPRGHEL